MVYLVGLINLSKGRVLLSGRAARLTLPEALELRLTLAQRLLRACLFSEKLFPPFVRAPVIKEI